MPLLEHCFVPGEQTPAQAPLTQAWFVHVVPLCHVPLASQVCGVSPLHWVAPGLQLPEQAPPLHTLTQAAPLTHVPVASQVCGTRPLHCLVPGVHTPVHAPDTHA